MAVIRRYELTDEEWERLKVYFPERKAGAKGRPPKDTRQMLNGIFWILRSGASWRDLPERYGPWQTVYKHFAKWEKAGTLPKQALQSANLSQIIVAQLSLDVNRRTNKLAILCK